MAATILSKAATTVLFGVDAAIVALTGYIYSDGDTDYSSDQATCEDNQGSLVAIAFFNQMIDIKFVSLVLTGFTAPVIGSTVTIAAVKYAVMKVAIKTTNKRFQIVTIDLKRWPDNLVPN